MPDTHPDTGTDSAPLSAHRHARHRSARSADLVALGAVTVAVLLANLPVLAHLVTTNPLVINAYLTPPTNGWLAGLPYIDPNSGFTTQALGHLAALDWVHGHVPWWNPYEGVGAPLAGEMQSGAFFPPTLLLYFHQGMVALQLSLELVTGWSTYYLVRRLGVTRSFSTAAGVAFGLCGTYAWLSHAPIRPVALLPLSLIGVERARTATAEGRSGGWRLLAVAIGLSLLAGFPETAFIDGLLVAIWAVLRAPGTGRSTVIAYLSKVAGGVIGGVALAAPLLMAFVTYLPDAVLGGHSGNGFAYASIPTSGVAQVVLPYSLGPIFGYSSTGTVTILADIWGSVGGFLSVTVIAAGLVGLVGRRHRPLRIGLGAWAALCLLRTYGFAPVVHTMAVIPGLRSIAFFRYADPSWELAVVVLAALGLDDLARRATRRRVLAVAAGLTAALAGWAAWSAWQTMATATVSRPGTHTTHALDFPAWSLVAALVLLAVLGVGGAWAGRRPGRSRSERFRRRGRILMAGAVCIESIGLLGFTALSAPSPTILEAGSVAWLQANLGTARFYTFGPIQPNYGSYFGISQLNINDLPWPKALNTAILGQLDPNSPPGVFTGGARQVQSGPTPAEELTAHQASYQAMGVRYIVEPADGTDVLGSRWPAAGTPPWPVGPRLVHRDQLAEIWELPSAAPFFSAVTDPGGRRASCAVVAAGTDQVTVTCLHPAVVTRRVQFVAGWSANVDGHPVPVEHAAIGPSGLFQQVAVPAGRSTVQFSFLPPYTVPATAVAALAAAAVVGSWVAERRRARRSAQAQSDAASGAPG